MSKDLDMKKVNFKQLAALFSKRFGKHLIFAAVLLVLLVYVFIVFRINSLAKADPSPDQQVTASNSVPKVDPKAIKQIEELEQSNTEVHALFENARNNPFQE